MKCRRMVGNKITWFNSIGIDDEDNRIYSENYADKQEGVTNSLRQRLSVIKGELWYDINAGIPLLDSNKSDVVYDSYISSILLKHPDVVSIEKFKSEVINHKYSCEFIVNTIYGQIQMKI